MDAPNEGNFMLHIGTKYHAAVAALNEKHRRALERVQEDYATELMEISLRCETEMEQCLRTFKGETSEPTISVSGQAKAQPPVQAPEPLREPIRPPLPKRAVDMLKDKDKDDDGDFFPRVVTAPR